MSPRLEYRPHRKVFGWLVMIAPILLSGALLSKGQWVAASLSLTTGLNFANGVLHGVRQPWKFGPFTIRRQPPTRDGPDRIRAA